MALPSSSSSSSTATDALQLDEFDLIPDPFAGNEDINWSQLLATPVTTQVAPTHRLSPEYFPDDSSLDESFLAQLDALDSSIPISTTNHPTSILLPQPTIPLLAQAQQPIHLAEIFSPNFSASPLQTKKQRKSPDSPDILTPSRKNNSRPSPKSGSKRKRRKTVDIPRHILDGFEEELTCPICCDIFVATHLLNPCGHSYCGPCAWQWIARNRTAGCPVCRAPLTNTPMVPNICIDKTVETHIQMLCYNGDIGWREGGPKLIEFRERQRKWKDGVGEREKVPRVVVKPIVFVVVSDDEEEEETWEEALDLY
ncbi:hypothetical protein B0H11DRAFT_2054006 [Mycena galericulata]|nr:hypothetical protein B0H11DRAFT_2054006 [Mycena galericulata]